MMSHRWSTALLCVAAGAAVAFAAPRPAADPGAAAAFERIKALEGRWSLADDAARVVQSEFRVTAGGSAVLETLFPGTEKEMITLYFVADDELRLTHYCMLGNQPTMVARAASAEGDLDWEFTGGCNIDPDTTMHMHSARYAFRGADRLVATWSMYDQGEEVEVKEFDLVRLPAAE